jgi:hypothetical protein
MESSEGSEEEVIGEVDSTKTAGEGSGGGGSDGGGGSEANSTPHCVVVDTLEQDVEVKAVLCELALKSAGGAGGRRASVGHNFRTSSCSFSGPNVSSSCRTFFSLCLFREARFC